MEQLLMEYPHSIQTFEKCRDTFLRHHIIPLAYTSFVQQAIMDKSDNNRLDPCYERLSI
jgi:hypothetical protein